jgi:hypothetical protein
MQGLEFKPQYCQTKPKQTQNNKNAQSNNNNKNPKQILKLHM